ncbi:MAG: hypothetical protein WAW61_02025, partial [Methylococcaceae bacterium]
MRYNKRSHLSGIGNIFIYGILIKIKLLRAHKLSGFVAHKLSGFHTVPGRYRDETGRMVTGDSENEIRRSVWRLAGRAF